MEYKLENRLRFVHDNNLYENFEAVKNHVEGYYEQIERPALYAEPMVFKYGTEDNPNIVLVIGSVGDGTTSKSNKHFFIDFANVVESIEDIKEELENESDEIENLTKILNNLIASTGVEEDGTYKANPDDELLKEAVSLSDADNILSNAIKELKESSKLTPQTTNTVKLYTEPDVEGRKLFGEVRVPEKSLIDGREVENQIIVAESYEENTGLFHNVNVLYNKDENTLTFEVNGEVKNTYEVSEGTYIESGEYNPEKEMLVFHYNKEGMEDLEIDVRTILNEWNVPETGQEANGVALSLERNTEKDERGHWQDILSAKICLSEKKDNLLRLKEDGLYAPNKAKKIFLENGESVQDAIDDIVEASISSEDGNIIVKKAEDGGLYADVDINYNTATNTLILTKSGQTEKEIALNNFAFLEEVVYNKETEELVIKYKSNKNAEQVLETRVPVSSLFEEYQGVSNDNTHSVDVSIERNIDGVSKISADVRIASKETKPNNILEKTDLNRLYVDGTASNITCSDGKTVEETLTGIDSKITAETGRATAKEDELSTAIGTEKARAEEVEGNLQASLETLSGTVSSNKEELDGKIEAEEKTREEADNEIKNVLGGESMGKEYTQSDLYGTIDYVKGENVRADIAGLANELYNHTTASTEELSKIQDDLKTATEAIEGLDGRLITVESDVETLKNDTKTNSDNLANLEDGKIKNIIEGLGFNETDGTINKYLASENIEYAVGDTYREKIANIDSALKNIATSADSKTIEVVENKNPDDINNWREYVIKQNGEQVGSTIVIPKDTFVADAKVEDQNLILTLTNGETVTVSFSDIIFNSEFEDGLKVTDGKVSVVLSDQSKEYLYFDNDSNYEHKPIRFNYELVNKNIEDSVLAEAETRQEKDEELQEQIGNVKTESTVTLEKVTDGIAANVEEQYVIKQNNEPIGVPITIYKDQHLVSVTRTDEQHLEFVYTLADGSEKTVVIDFTQMVIESELGKGLNYDENGNVNIYLSSEGETQKFLGFTDEKALKLDGITNAIGEAKRDLEDQINAEVKRATDKEEELVNELQDLSSTVSDNKVELEGKINTNNKVVVNLLGELGANSDGSLTPYDPQEVNYIANTTSVREDLITLDNTIKSEITGVQTSINAETERATDKEDELSNAIGAEKARAEEVEGNLQASLETLSGTVSSNKEELDGKIEAEVVRATGIEKNIIASVGLNDDGSFVKFGAGEVTYATSDNNIREQIKQLDSAIAASEISITTTGVVPQENNVAYSYTISQGDKEYNIVISKDSFLKEVVKTDEDEISFTFVKSDGQEETTSIKLDKLILETEFDNGLVVNDNGVVSVNLSTEGDTATYMSFTDGKALKLDGISAEILKEKSRAEHEETELKRQTGNVSDLLTQVIETLGFNDNGEDKPYNNEVYIKEDGTVHGNIEILDKAISALNDTIFGDTGTISNINGKLDDLEGRVSDNEDNIAENTASISTKAEQKDVDGLATRIEAIETNVGLIPAYTIESIVPSEDLKAEYALKANGEITGDTIKIYKDENDNNWLKLDSGELLLLDNAKELRLKQKNEVGDPQQDVIVDLTNLASMSDVDGKIKGNNETVINPIKRQVETNSSGISDLNDQISDLDKKVDGVKTELIGTSESSYSTILGLKQYVDNTIKTNEVKGVEDNAVRVDAQTVWLRIDGNGEGYLKQSSNGLRIEGVDKKFADVNDKIGNIKNYTLGTTSSSITLQEDPLNNIIAEVKRSTKEDNILEIYGDGLYVGKPEVSYDGAKNVLTINGKEFPLNTGSIITDAKYSEGYLVISFNTTDGQTNSVSIPVSDFYTPVTAEGDRGIKLEIKEKSTVKATLIRDPQASNMLEIGTDGLLVSDAPIIELRSQLETLSGTVNASKEDILKIKGDLGAAQNYIEDNKSRITAIGGNVDSINISIAEINKEHSTLISQVGNHETKLESIFRDISNLENTDVAINGRIDGLDDRTSNVEKAINGGEGLIAITARQQIEIEKLKQKIGDFNEKIGDFNDAISRITNLESRMASIESQIGSIQTSVVNLEGLITTVNNLQTAVTTLNTTVGQYSSDIKDLKDKSNIKGDLTQLLKWEKDGIDYSDNSTLLARGMTMM